MNDKMMFENAVNNIGKKKNGKKKGERRSTSKQTAKYVTPKEIRAGGFFEYEMPNNVISDLLKDCKKDAQEFLCDYVNEQYGLLGTCVRVIGR